MRSLFIGRYQPLHDGHVALINTVGGRVAIGLRDTPIGPSNPFSLAERVEMIRQRWPEAKVWYPGQRSDSRVVIVPLPDIGEVCYGRDVGYGIRRIELPEDIESISGTSIRDHMANRK